MAESEDWLLRPIEAGMCRYESLKDCSLDLVDIARMNDRLDVTAENQKRYDKANDT